MSSTSTVLGDDDLLGEILLRVDCPTALVRAALACKRWLRRASGRAFLRLFRARHPPRLLGFFVTGHCLPRPVFVPMPALRDADKALAAAVRRAGVGSGAGPQAKSGVMDCRNGRVLVGTFEILRGEGVWRFAVLDPLRRPRGSTAVVPPPARLDLWPDCSQGLLLPEDGENDASSCCVDVDRDDDDDGSNAGLSGTVQVSALRSDGSWAVRSRARAELATPPDRVPMLMLLAGGKLYMLAEAGYLLGLDLAAASLFVLEFPAGVAFDHCGGLALARCSRGHAAFYLLNVKGLQLTVWLRRSRTDGGHGAGGEWVLTNTVSVRDTCADHLGTLGSKEPADGGAPADVVSVVGVGDDAEFAFLELGRSNGVVVYMHLASRRVEKVYQREPDNDHLIDVCPFLMLWPPVFPARDLDAEDGEVGAHQW